METYFEKHTLLEHLAHLEEDNLFKIHLVQDDEQALEKLRRGVQGSIQAKEQEIRDMQHNIDTMRASIQQLSAKHAFLDANTRSKQGKHQPQRLEVIDTKDSLAAFVQARTRSQEDTVKLS